MPTRTQRLFPPNGQLRTEIPILNGQAHGLRRDCHPNGQLAAEIPYGLQNGIARVWASDGRFIGTYTLEHGAGIAKLWYDNGQLLSEVSR